MTIQTICSETEEIFTLSAAARLPPTLLHARLLLAHVCAHTATHYSVFNSVIVILMMKPYFFMCLCASKPNICCNMYMADRQALNLTNWVMSVTDLLTGCETV